MWSLILSFCTYRWLWWGWQLWHFFDFYINAKVSILSRTIKRFDIFWRFVGEEIQIANKKKFLTLVRIQYMQIKTIRIRPCILLSRWITFKNICPDVPGDGGLASTHIPVLRELTLTQLFQKATWQHPRSFRTHTLWNPGFGPFLFLQCLLLVYIWMLTNQIRSLCVCVACQHCLKQPNVYISTNKIATD